MFWTYIIKSGKTGSHYTGSCGNIEARLKDHNGNKVKSTRNKDPYKLVYMEGSKFKKDALRREKQIKSFKGGRAFKKLTSSPSSSLA